MKLKYNVLVLGAGGREHAIIKKLKESPYLDKIYAFPGNGGISQDAEIPEISDDFKTINSFVKEKNISIVIPGPEAYIVKGIKDYIEGTFVFAPEKLSARLEGSKAFAKNFMKKYGIPTAPFEIFDEPEKAIDYLKTKKEIVVKADGLAGGKGAYVCNNFDESKEAVKQIMIEKKFGEAGNKVVIEEKLTGEEASILALISGENYAFFLPSQDHKQIYEGDRGPNTGGMGAYAPTTLIDNAILKKCEEKIIKRVIEGLIDEGLTYTGILYAGIMVYKNEPYVLEFNVRFGDPEIEALIPLLKSDLLETILLVKNQENFKLEWEKGYCVDVVLASKGYPGKYEKGKEIFISSEIPDDIYIYHAGTVIRGNKLLTNGGRVLNIAGKGKRIKEAREKVYSAIKYISFENMYYRRDIGLKEEKRQFI